jgi:2-oxo-4-hydroxy-4-carboxy-5-ureidoimidazoline decarboxylase
MESTDGNAGLAMLCLMPPDILAKELYRCCGSTGWVEGMLQRFPFATKEKLLEEATTVWWNLPTDQWHMAFLAHPQIGKIYFVPVKYDLTSKRFTNTHPYFRRCSRPEEQICT